MDEHESNGVACANELTEWDFKRNLLSGTKYGHLSTTERLSDRIGQK